MKSLKQFQRGAKDDATRLGRLDGQKEPLRIGFVLVGPTARGRTDSCFQNEPAPNVLVSVRFDPTIKRDPDERRWLAYRLRPIRRGHNVQLDETFGQENRETVIGYQAMHQRDAVESGEC
jgi:hypothetical protein